MKPPKDYSKLNRIATDAVLALAITLLFSAVAFILGDYHANY